jgi:murein L,D-transpeptidase YafK
VRFLHLSLILLLSPVCCIASELKIVVWKESRKLEVFRKEELLHSFPVGLGHSPIGDKERSGDGKTPEGSFYICVKNPKSRFYLSLGISYPDIADAERGMRGGLISKKEHDQIVAAQSKKRVPPWDTALGGEIFIHGRGARSDWTLGCIALEDSDMKTLFDLIDVGATVEINP